MPQAHVVRILSTNCVAEIVAKSIGSEFNEIWQIDSLGPIFYETN